MKSLQSRALNLNELIMGFLLSSKLPGEEYSVMKTRHNSLILGKHEVHEMTNLQVADDKASFTFPELSEDVTKAFFGNADHVHFQVLLRLTER